MLKQITNYLFVFVLLLLCLVEQGQSENLPLFIKHIDKEEQYVFNSICSQQSYDIVDLNNFQGYPLGEILARNSTNVLLQSAISVPMSDTLQDYDLTFAMNNGTEYKIFNVSKTLCVDIQHPLEIKLNYIPQTFNDVLFFNQLFYKPKNSDTNKLLSLEPNIIKGAFVFLPNVGPAKGYYQLISLYQVKRAPDTTDQSFTLTTGSGASTTITVPTFLEKYYPPGNVLDVRFYPSNGTEKDINNVFVIELETTGNPVFAAVRYGYDHFTRPFFPVYKKNGVTKQVSVMRLRDTNMYEMTVDVEIFNKQNPIGRSSYWKTSDLFLPSVSSTDSSFFVVDQIKKLTMLNFEMYNTSNLNPAYSLFISPRNSTSMGEFIGAGNEKEYTYSRSILTHFLGNITNVMVHGPNFLFPDFLLPFEAADVTPPVIVSIEFESLPNGFTLIRLHITDDISGFSIFFFSYNYAVVSPANLVSGTLLDGVYELRMQTYFTPAISYSIYVRDKAGNYGSYSDSTSRPYYNMQSQLPEVPILKVDYEDITTFRFEPNNINVTTFGSLCTLYFGFKGMTSDNSIPLFIRLSKSIDLLELEDISILKSMRWDSSLNLYKYQFFIPPRLFTGNIDYQIFIGQTIVNPTTTYQFFGEQALLKVYSDISDEMPPIVTKYSFSPSSVTINQGQSVQVTLTVDIEDPINGLDYGSIKIGSDYDSKVGYSFTFTPVDAINKNPYYGTYQFKFTVNGNCRSQNFKIIAMGLTDTSGHRSVMSAYSTSVINPLYKLYDTPVTMPLTCTATVDTTPPTIKSLTFSRTSFASSNSLDREITVTMTAEDLNGISLRHTPYLYMVDDVLAENKVSFSIVSSDSTKVNYKLTTRIPFNYGADVGFIVGIYGLYDNHLNTNGYSSEDLRKAGFTYFIKTQITTTPVLESYLPILSTGGDLHVYGQRFNGNNVVISIDYLDGNGYQPVSTIKKTATSFTIGNVLPKKTSLFVKMAIDGIDSNEMLVIPTPAKPTESFCKGNPICGGPNRGYCANVETGCVCYPPYFGIDCSNTDALGGSNPNIDPTTPNTGNNVTTDEISFAYYISITELKELDLNGGTVQHYYLKDWTFTNVSTTVRKEYQYSTNITNNDVSTEISVNLRFYDKQEQVIFANNEYFMSPNSVKYIVTMTPYGFSSRLNYLELLMASNFSLDASKDSCSSISKGNSSINAEYIQIKVNDRYLYSRFIKLGEIDSKPQQIINKFMDSNEEQTKTSAVSYVGVQIPFYTKSVLLDPDFSVLIDTSKPASADENAVCGDKEEAQSSKSGLTKVQIAGIVIGAVGFAAVVAAGVIYSVYKNQQSIRIRKSMQAKLETFHG